MSAVEQTVQPPPLPRRVFCNRTLNFRSLRAVGFDMDYTLIHYRIEEWEGRAFEHAKEKLLGLQWPVQDLRFDPTMAARGLVIDTALGNVVKADRFGYVKQASHGTSMLGFEDQKRLYLREVIDLREPRWEFMNTLFALSEACLYAQTVELLDQRKLPSSLGYEQLYRIIRSSVDEAHMMGRLKAEIMADPDAFVELDPELPQTLWDLKQAGKKTLLITNSGWTYTRAMMAYAFDRFLPPGVSSWRELFDLVIVVARKPLFFQQRNPVFEVVDDDELLRPITGELRPDGLYFGGDAATVEEHLGVSGSEILYVGDHIFADVNLSKSLLRWRTAVVVRELEQELRALAAFRPQQQLIASLMSEKETLEQEYAHLRLLLQRRDLGQVTPDEPRSSAELKARLHALRGELTTLDERLAPHVQADSTLGHPRWGLTMRAGNDKSHFARQIERYADIYLSRVSNLRFVTPYGYLRAPRSTLPHDPLEP